MTDPTAPTAAASYDDAAVEALLSGRGPAGDPLTATLAGLRAAGTGAAPVSSPALAALLEGGAPVDPFTRRRTRGRVVLGVVVAGGTTLALSGVAAAHNALPGPAQTVVTSIIDHCTPFDIAAHGGATRTGIAPTGSRPGHTGTPARTVTPAHTATPSTPTDSVPSPGTGHRVAPGSARPSREPGDDRRRGSGSSGPSGGGDDGGGDRRGRPSGGATDGGGTGGSPGSGGTGNGSGGGDSGDDGSGSGRGGGSGGTDGGGSGGGSGSGPPSGDVTPTNSGGSRGGPGGGDH